VDVTLEICGFIVSSASRITPRSLTALLGLMVLEPMVTDLSMLARLARRDGLPNHASSVFIIFNTAFTNGESMKCIILRFINILELTVN